MGVFESIFGSANKKELKKIEPIIKKIESYDKSMQQLSDDELKHKTGNDKEVQDYVMSFPKSVTFMEKLEDFMEFMIPLYIEEGKISLTIAIGCTGGKHRSVTMTNKLADYLKSCDYTVNVSYRDMGRE